MTPDFQRADRAAHLPCRLRETLCASFRSLPCACLLLIGLALSGQGVAQVPGLEPLAVPNIDLVSVGAVQEMERLPDGKLMIAGGFDRVGTHLSQNLARLNANGSVDTSFSASAIDGGAEQIRTDTLGRTYVLSSTRMRRYASDGALDTSFADVTFGGSPARSFAFVSDGIIIGGSFATVASGPVNSGSTLAREGLVKVRGDGSIDPDFVVPTRSVRVVLTTGFNEVLVGGEFTTSGGLARTGLAKLNTLGAGSVVSNWNPVLTSASGSPGVGDALISSSFVLITGRFDTVAGTARTRLAKISMAPGAALDANWNVSLQSALGVRLAQVGSDVLVSATDLAIYANPPAAPLPGRRLMRATLAGTGTIDAAFAPTFNSGSAAFPVILGNVPGRMVVGGNYFNVNETHRFAPTQLNFDGSVDTANVLGEAFESGEVSQIIVEPGTQRTYVSGRFFRAAGLPMRHCLRLNANGSLDTAWRAQTGSTARPQIALATGVGVGSGLYVEAEVGIVRLSLSNGVRIPSWINTSIDLRALLATPTAIYAVTNGPEKIQRLPLVSNGALDPAFAPAPNNTIFQAQFDAADNTLIVRGSFSQIGGGARQDFARINAATGSLISSFNPSFGPSTDLFKLVLDDEGGIWVDGEFDTVNGVGRNPPARLLSSGALDTAAFAFPKGNFSILGASEEFLYVRVSQDFDLDELRRVSVSGLDPVWKVVADNRQGFLVSTLQAMAFTGNQVLLGGTFNQIGNSTRIGLAAVTVNDVVFRNGFEN